MRCGSERVLEGGAWTTQALNLCIRCYVRCCLLDMSPLFHADGREHVPEFFPSIGQVLSSRVRSESNSNVRGK